MNARIRKKQIRINAKTNQLKAIQDQQVLSRYVKSVNPASFTTDKQLKRFIALQIKVKKNGSVSMPKFDEWDKDYVLMEEQVFSSTLMELALLT